MKDKIEVNEYVRTKYGIIYKIENGEEFYANSVDVGIGIIPDVEGIWIDRECLDYIDKRDIAKHSKQLIDLIEVEDFVNGHKVKAIYLNGATKYIKLDNAYKDGQGTRTYEENIETILTKESYMANCYKVGGEDE